MTDTVSAVAALANTLKPVARWFVVLTAMAAVALWTLVTPPESAAMGWQLVPILLRGSVVIGWMCAAFVLIPVYATISGVLTFVGPRIGAGWLFKPSGKKVRRAIAATTGGDAEVGLEKGTQSDFVDPIGAEEPPIGGTTRRP